MDNVREECRLTDLYITKEKNSDCRHVGIHTEGTEGCCRELCCGVTVRDTIRDKKRRVQGSARRSLLTVLVS